MAQLVLTGGTITLNDKTPETAFTTQSAVKVTRLKDGTFVAVWADDSGSTAGNQQTDIHARIFDADGAPVSEEMVLNTNLAKNQTEPSVVALQDGGFVVTWTDENSGFGLDIYGQAFDADGTPRETVKQYTNYGGDQHHGSLVARPEGGYMLWYTSKERATQDSDILGYVQFPTNSVEYPYVSTSDAETLEQVDSAVAALSTGRYAVVYQEQTATGFQIKGKLFAYNMGTVEQPDFAVAAAGRDMATVGLRGASDDRFVVTWTTYDAGTLKSTGIQAQIFDKFGQKVGVELTIASGETAYSALTVLPNGGFAIAYTDKAGNVYLAAYDGEGARITGAGGGDLLVHAAADGIALGEPSLTALDNGELIVSWTNALTKDVEAHRVSTGTNTAPQEPALTPNAAHMVRDQNGVYLIDETAGAVIIGTANAVDPDFGGTPRLRYSLESTHDGLCSINAATGELSVADATKLPVAADTDYAIKVLVADGEGGFSNKTFTLRVKNVSQDNVAPVIDRVAASGHGTAGYGVDAGTIVVRKESGEGAIAKVAAHDPTGEAMSYALGGDNGSHDGLFSIAADGTISVADASKLPATASTYTLTVLVTDGEFTTAKDVQVRVKPNQNPTDIGLSKTWIAENAPNGAAIGALGGQDPEGDTLTYALVDDADGRFAIRNGWLVVNNPTKIDYETTKSHQITVQVTDSYGGTYEEVLTIAVTDALEIRTGTAGSDRMILASPSEAHGGRGNDAIFGSIGNDIIWGGTGNDALKGGRGKDVFVFDTKADRKTNFDKLTDLSVADDTIWLDNKVFAKLGSGSPTAPKKLSAKFFTIGDGAKDLNDHLIYNSKTGVLSYDADGSGAGKAVDVALFKPGLKLTYKDFLII